MKKTISIPSDLFLSSVLESLSQGNMVQIFVTGRSMSPTLRHKKDRVVLKAVPSEEIRVNDVVLFDRGDKICLHRVIKRDGDRLIIRGDGNSAKALERVTVDKVYGKVVSGTMLGGKQFTLDDALWQRQNRRLEKYFPLWERAHYVRNILMRYPFSIIVLAISLYLSFCPQQEGEPPFENFDKFVHIAMYFAICVVWWFEWLKAHKITKSVILKGSLLCFVFPIALGGLIEIAQGCLTATRVGDIMDFYANAAGAVAGLIVTFAATIPIFKVYRRNNTIP